MPRTTFIESFQDRGFIKDYHGNLRPSVRTGALIGGTGWMRSASGLTPSNQPATIGYWENDVDGNLIPRLK